jgi:transposase InsO family protein
MVDEEGLLYKTNQGGTPRLVIPEMLVDRLIRDHHDAKNAAYAGVKKTQQWMKKKYYWPTLHRDVEDYVLSRDQCARLRASRTITAPMGNLPEARNLGEVASIDITGPYATSTKGNRYLLTYIDHFTKWAEAVHLPDQEATTVTNALVTQIFTPHGVCDKLLSDRGRNITSEIIREVFRLLGVDKLFTSPDRPQSNGQVERFHRTLHAGLVMYSDPNGTSWDDHLNFVLWAYRSQPHGSTGYSPYHLAHGMEMKGPSDRELTAYEKRNRQEVGSRGCVSRLAQKLRRARRIAREK